MALSHLPFVLADTYRSLFEKVPFNKMIKSPWSSLYHYFRSVPVQSILSSLGAYEEYLCDRMFVNAASLGY